MLKKVKNLKIKLGTKITVIICLIIFISLSFLALTAYKNSSDSLMDAAVEKLSNESFLYAKIIDDFMAQRQGDITIVSQHPVLRDREASIEEKTEVLTMYKENYKVYHTISMTDPSGLQIIDTRGIVGDPKDDLEWFTSAREGHLYISDMRLSRDLGIYMINFSYPIYCSETNEFLGVVVARLALEDTIYKTVNMFADEERKAGRTGYAYMINQEGTFIAHPNDNLVFKQNILEQGIPELREAGQKMIRGENGTARYEFEGETRYVGFTHLHGSGDYEGKGWTFAISIVNEEFLAPIIALRNISIITFLAAVLLSIAAANLFTKQITNPISQIAVLMNLAAQGNFSRKAEIKSRDEIGELGDNFNTMIDSLSVLMRKATEISTSVKQFSNTLSSLAASTSTSLQQVTASTNHFTKSSYELSSSTREMTEISKEVSDSATEGDEAVLSVIQQMKDINNMVENLTDVMQELDNRSKEIGEIVNMITAVADQTNLLALNATIEAAHAGEQGKGFVVVAREVRKLAEQSAKAADNISNLIKEAQEETTEAVETIKQGVEKVKISSEVISSNSETFQTIVGEVQKIVEKINQVSVETEYINTGSQEIAAAAEQQSYYMEEISTTADQLRNLAQELHSALDKFKYSNNHR